jgi:hypothetical protein
MNNYSFCQCGNLPEAMVGLTAYEQANKQTWDNLRSEERKRAD